MVLKCVPGGRAVGGASRVGAHLLEAEALPQRVSRSRLPPSQGARCDAGCRARTLGLVGAAAGAAPRARSVRRRRLAVRVAVRLRARKLALPCVLGGGIGARGRAAAATVSLPSRQLPGLRSPVVGGFVLRHLFSRGRTETCRFSGLKIYPGRVRLSPLPSLPRLSPPPSQGIKLARTDCQVFLFLNAKCKRLFNNKLKASKLAWTALYRKAHKKDQSTESARRKRRSTKVTATRSIVGASLELLQKRRNEKSDVRVAARENALREVKERVKKAKAEKQATRAKVAASAPKQAKQSGGAPKGGAKSGKRY